MHDFRIEFDKPTRGSVWIDGQPLQGVRAVRMDAGVDKCTVVTIELYAKSVNAGESVKDLPYLIGEDGPELFAPTNA